MQRQNHLKNFYLLSRPLNVLIAFLSIEIGALLANGGLLSLPVLLAALTAGFTMAAANIVNDIYDIDIDRINKPRRLLASGRVSVKLAAVYALTATMIAWLLAALNGWTMFFVAVLIAVLLYFYDRILKRTVLWGNLAVSLCGGLAFIYGAMAAGRWQMGVIPFGFAFLFHLGREIIKDMQDLKGDRAAQALTFPARFGMRASVMLVTLVFLLLVVFTILPYILSIYNKEYLYAVLFGVDSVLIVVSIVLWFKTEPAVLGKLSHVLKLDMIIGLIALYIGSGNVIFIN